MTARRPIYLDSHATTQVDPRVLDAMLPFFCEQFGNAASINHQFGWEARDAVERARTQVADLLNVSPKGIVFTSGATEANNLALKGVLQAAGNTRGLIVNAAEHRAILDPAKRLQRMGHPITVLPVDATAQIDPQQIDTCLSKTGSTTALVSVMGANNEVGTLNPVADIADICREHSVLFHSDLSQWAGRLPLDLTAWGVDLASLSGHKLYGPKGVGVLYVRQGAPRIRLEPLFDGGGQEGRLRSGTLAVPLIVGLGAACVLAGQLIAEESRRIAQLRDRLQAGLCAGLTGIRVHGHPDDRLPGNLNVSFACVDGEALMIRLKDIAVSSGSACTTADPEPSHVLHAMGISTDEARRSLRFGLGRFTTEAEIDWTIAYVIEQVTLLRRLTAQHAESGDSGSAGSVDQNAHARNSEEQKGH